MVSDELAASRRAGAAEALGGGAEARQQQAEGMTPGRPSPVIPARAGRRLWVRRSLFLLLPVALIVGFLWYSAGGQVVSTDDAYVEADKVGVSTDVSGIVREVAVTENQHVETGQILYRLDDLPFRLALARADAQIGMVRDNLEALKANYAGYAGRRSQRHRTISPITTATFTARRSANTQHVVSAVRSSRRRGATCRTRNRSSPRSRSSWPWHRGKSRRRSPDGPIDQHPRYRDAVAQRDEAARQLDHTIVKAPFSGIVTDVPAIAPGKYLPASTTAFFLVAADHVWIDANPERDAAGLRAAGPIRDDNRRYLSGRPVARYRGEHQPGGCTGIFAAAGAEHQRQLGEGRTADPHACPGRYARRQPAPACVPA